MKDLHNNLKMSRAISPVSVADNTAQVSEIVDMDGFSSLEYAIALGSIADADATFAVLVEEGNDSGLSDATAVADADLVGTEADAGFDFNDDNLTKKIGYVGSKRFVRLTITPSANASAALMSVLAVQGHADIRPV